MNITFVRVYIVFNVYKKKKSIQRDKLLKKKKKNKLAIEGKVNGDNDNKI